MKPFIVFDFDGTIADSLELIVESYNAFCHILGKPKLTEAFTDELRNYSAKEIIKKYISWWELPIIAYLGKRQMAKNLHKLHFVEGMEDVLLELKKQGFRLGILSSNSYNNVFRFLKMQEISSAFEFVIGEKQLFGKSKSILKILKKFNLHKNQLIYIGDEVKDVEACKEAGVRVISVAWGLNNVKALETANKENLIYKPAEILEKLKLMA